MKLLVVPEQVIETRDKLISDMRKARETVEAIVGTLQRTLNENSDPDKLTDNDALDRVYVTQLLNEARGMEQLVSGTSANDQGGLARAVDRYRNASKDLEAYLVDQGS